MRPLLVVFPREGPTMALMVRKNRGNSRNQGGKTVHSTLNSVLKVAGGAVSLCFLACGSSTLTHVQDAAAVTGTGGSTLGTGGTSIGTSQPAAGGVLASGGVGAGGARESGGAVGLGGESSVGGRSATSGTTGTGGRTGAGGTNATGSGIAGASGTSGSGGAIATGGSYVGNGGSSSTGGKSDSGGSMADGGRTGGGGTIATGGTVGTGGATATGGTAGLGRQCRSVAGRLAIRDTDRLQSTLSAVWEQLEKVRRQLETMFNDVQDFEFTVQNGQLYLLQTRTAKRTPWAAVKIACDLVKEGLIRPNEALSRLEAINLDKVVRSHLSGVQDAQLAQATIAGIGVATGRIALDGEAAKRFTDNGEPAILVRRETTTADITGMANAAGILTALGGRTSHAAVVARQLGKVCLVGCADVSVDPGRRTCRIAQQDFTEGDWLTLDGNSGAVYGGRLEVSLERPEAELATIARWRDSSSASRQAARSQLAE